MDTSILEDLGLSKGEVKVYLVLLSIGVNKVGKVIENTGMASSAVHNAVNSLIDKGLISYIKKGKIKFYKAVSPKQLVNFVEDKKRRIQKLLPELELKQKLAGQKNDGEVFEGTRGIISMLNLLIDGARRGQDYLFFAINVVEKNSDIQRFFLNYDVKRKEKGLRIRGIAPESLVQLFKTRRILKMKYSKTPIPGNISICGDKMAMFSWGDKPVGYLIKSKQLSTMYKNYFESVWGDK